MLILFYQFWFENIFMQILIRSPIILIIIRIFYHRMTQSSFSTVPPGVKLLLGRYSCIMGKPTSNFYKSHLIYVSDIPYILTLPTNTKHLHLAIAPKIYFIISNLPLTIYTHLFILLLSIFFIF